MRIKTIAIVLVIIGIAILGVLFMDSILRNRISSVDNSFREIANSYYINEFKGVVVKKYVDREQHNFKKIVLLNNQEEEVVRLDFEKSKLFDYIEVGDSIYKNKKTLKLKLTRGSYDTVIRLKFDNLKNHEKYSRFLEDLEKSNSNK